MEETLMQIFSTLTGKNYNRARKALFDVINLLENEKIEYYLEGGTLL
ncbi:MAG: hypothetical protein JW944_06760 [Deltaproteobacteria bacterium]|nr:hypothetical protein [Deltaproteobacteria bacterium]